MFGFKNFVPARFEFVTDELAQIGIAFHEQDSLRFETALNLIGRSVLDVLRIGRHGEAKIDSRSDPMLASNVIIGWVNGKYEIGPRALGNRSILASPFQERTRVRLNEIKQREQFRPIAPVCLEEDAVRCFGCDYPSPFMLYTQQVYTDALLPAVTHVNGTARIQTVTSVTNSQLFELLMAFKARTGSGVLCNTSLNFKGRGFINNIADLAKFTIERQLDGFVIGGRSYMLKSSKSYQAYLTASNSSDCRFG